MDQDSQASEAVRITPLEAQLRECFGRVAYTHKTHEKCADICSNRLSRNKLFQIILSAITTGGLITVVFGSKEVSQVSAMISVLASTALLGLNTYMKDSNPGQLAEKHSKAASELWDVRESYLSLLTDLRCRGVEEAAIREKRDALQSKLAKIYESAPRTTTKGYERAREGLKENEDLTFSDKELDELLPPVLRSTRP